MFSDIITHAIAAVFGAIGFGLIIKQNAFVQKLFNITSDKIEKVVEDKLDIDL